MQIYIHALQLTYIHSTHTKCLAYFKLAYTRTRTHAHAHNLLNPLTLAQPRVHRQMDAMTFYPQLLAATGEVPPYLLIGWGGGGTSVYRYAKVGQNNLQLGFSLGRLGIASRPGWQFCFLRLRHAPRRRIYVPCYSEFVLPL